MDTERKVAVLFDAENIASKYTPVILNEANALGSVIIRRIYGDWTAREMSSWKQVILDHSIQPIQQYSNTNGKNSTDSAMIIDAMDILYSGNVEGFCLVSSDSDFTKLAQRLRESGMFVLGMGEQKTPSSFRVACDAFKILEVISQNEDDISPAIPAVSESSARSTLMRTGLARQDATISALSESTAFRFRSSYRKRAHLTSKKSVRFTVRSLRKISDIISDCITLGRHTASRAREL